MNLNHFNFNLKVGDEIYFEKGNIIDTMIIKKIGDRYGFGNETHRTYKSLGTLRGMLNKMMNDGWTIFYRGNSKNDR